MAEITEMKDTKVLIVLYYWPPAGGPGVQRWLKFVKYLSDFGIEAVVYCPKNANYPIIDQSLLNDIPTRAPCYLGYNLIVLIFDYKTITFFGQAFQLIRLISTFNHSRLSRYP